MTFEQYQRDSRMTALYEKQGLEAWYPALGLAGEAGEVADLVKKLYRDDAGELSIERQRKMKKELGDVLWYLAQLCTDFDLSLEEVAADNLDKLMSRMERGKIRGDGDDR